MSQATPSQISAPRQGRSARAAAAAASLLALGAVVLTFTLGAAQQNDGETAGLPAQPAVRTDGGPQESAVAAVVGGGSAAAPDESAVAANISGAGRAVDSTKTTTGAYTPMGPRPSDAAPSTGARSALIGHGAR